MITPAKKAAANGLVGITFSSGIFAAWMIAEVYAGMSGEEFAWMIVFPIPVVVILGMCQLLVIPLAISFYTRRPKIKAFLVLIAFGLQLLYIYWITRIPSENEDDLVSLTPFWMGSLLLWVIAIATHAYIAQQPPEMEEEGNSGFD